MSYCTPNFFLHTHTFTGTSCCTHGSTRGREMREKLIDRKRLTPEVRLKKSIQKPRHGEHGRTKKRLEIVKDQETNVIIYETIIITVITSVYTHKCVRGCVCVGACNRRVKKRVRLPPALALCSL